MVCVGPGIGALGEAAVGHLVQQPLVRVLLGAKKDQMFEGVRQAIIVVRFGGLRPSRHNDVS